MGVLRNYIKPFNCVPSVVCGDIIDAIWGNEIRNLGQSAFERGETVVSQMGRREGRIVFPIYGYVWNMIHAYDNQDTRRIEYEHAIGSPRWDRFQVMYPQSHHVGSLYEGSVEDGSDFGVPEDDNGILGRQSLPMFFENAGYNTVQIQATVRRGERYLTSAPITNTGSDIQIYELKDSDPMNILGYRQHIQCWYCRENPSGSGFPPLKWLLFDDADCPIQAYAYINKEITITPPASTETQRDWIVVSMWNDAPYFAGFGGKGFNYPDGYFVMNTTYQDYEIHSDGLLDMTVKLFKKC